MIAGKTVDASATEERILGARFHTGTTAAAVEVVLAGGLVMAPSAPGLAVDWVKSAAYREALLAADLNLTDSGFMRCCWQVRAWRRLPRLSGLGYLRALLERPELRRAGAVFWVMPDVREASVNLAWLRGQGVGVGDDDYYVAPHYGEGGLRDDELVAKVRSRGPRVVILAIGGGVQERLGLALRREFGREPGRPGVVCLGAAIAFLSGNQVAIPEWVDRWMLGWFWRIVSAPRRYLPRYLRAVRLVGLIARYGKELPPMDRAGRR